MQQLSRSLDPLADALDAAVGVSKVAVNDAGYVKNSLQAHELRFLFAFFSDSSVASHCLIADVHTLKCRLDKLGK
jgi:urease alpha subunit